VDVTGEVETDSYEIQRRSQELSEAVAQAGLKARNTSERGTLKLCTEFVSFAKYSQRFTPLQESKLGVISVHRKRDLPGEERRRITT